MSGDDWKPTSWAEIQPQVQTVEGVHRVCAQCLEPIPGTQCAIAIGHVWEESTTISQSGGFRSIVVCSEECQQAYEVRVHVKPVTVADGDLIRHLEQAIFNATSSTIGRPNTIITSEKIFDKLKTMLKAK